MWKKGTSGPFFICLRLKATYPLPKQAAGIKQMDTLYWRELRRISLKFPGDSSGGKLIYFHE